MTVGLVLIGFGCEYATETKTDERLLTQKGLEQPVPTSSSSEIDAMKKMQGDFEIQQEKTREEFKALLAAASAAKEEGTDQKQKELNAALEKLAEQIAANAKQMSDLEAKIEEGKKEKPTEKPTGGTGGVTARAPTGVETFHLPKMPASKPEKEKPEEKPAEPVAPTFSVSGPVGYCQYQGEIADECDVEEIVATWKFSGEGITWVDLNCSGHDKVNADELVAVPFLNGASFTGMSLSLSWSGEEDAIAINCHPIGHTADPTVNKDLGQIAANCDDDDQECPDCDLTKFDFSGNRLACWDD